MLTGRVAFTMLYTLAHLNISQLIVSCYKARPKVSHRHLHVFIFVLFSLQLLYCTPQFSSLLKKQRQGVSIEWSDKWFACKVKKFGTASSFQLLARSIGTANPNFRILHLRNTIPSKCYCALSPRMSFFCLLYFLFARV